MPRCTFTSAPGFVIGFVDESARPTANGLMYVVVSAVILREDLGGVRDSLRVMVRPGQPALHWNELPKGRRAGVLAAVAALPLVAVAASTGPIRPKAQERGRAATLQRLIHVLDHEEGVREVVIESRDLLLNRRDAAAISRLRASGAVSDDFVYRHLPKSGDPGLWAADVVTSALAASLTTKGRPYGDILDRLMVRHDRVTPP